MNLNLMVLVSGMEGNRWFTVRSFDSFEKTHAVPKIRLNPLICIFVEGIL